MSVSTRLNRAHMLCVALAVAAAMLATWPLAALAQSAPAASSSSMPMDMGSMPGMNHASVPAAPTTVVRPAAAVSHTHKASRNLAAPIKPVGHMLGMDHGGMHSASMPAMNEAVRTATSVTEPATMPAMDHAAMAGMTEGSPATQDVMSGMTMGAMQGGSPPPHARSPDYSDGVGYGPMMPHMHGNTPVGMLLLDQLETVHGRDGNGQAWEAQAWYGLDEDKLWLRSEGDVSKGKVEDGNIEALWNHAIATYWGSQLGVRHDFGAGPSRDWVAFGVQGLAPYWFELEATGYVGSAGRTAARLRADYEVLFTQRLILQPELEFNLYGKDDPARGIGSGLSDVQFGLRLRYEIRREFAPYVGINWVRRIGASADYARADGRPVFDQQLVAGFRIWF